MTSLHGESELLKADKRGRVRVTPQRRDELLAEFDRSGLSGARFAALSGVNYQTFAGWLHRRRKLQGNASAVVAHAKPPTVQWLETVIGKAQAPVTPANAPVLVRLPSGPVIELTHASQATIAGALLRAWEKALC
jgi:hypothetical protein